MIHGNQNQLSLGSYVTLAGLPTPSKAQTTMMKVKSDIPEHERRGC